jgi:pseudoazurin
MLIIIITIKELKMNLKSFLTGCCLVLSTFNAVAADHNVEMKNGGKDGSMVFEPGVINVAVGDTVHFLPTDQMHNSESVTGLVPAGATMWKGEMNKKVSVTVDKEGVYVYKCTPHTALAMVGVIVAGKPTNLADIKKNAGTLSSKFVTNKDRLDKYLAQVK